MSSAAPTNFTSAPPLVSECTSNFYCASVHTRARSITKTLTIIEPDLVVSKDAFPEGKLTIPSTPTTDANDETVFLTIATQNQVPTETSIIAKILRFGAVFPFR
ncbi:MAG TPA: hypothetical protein VGS11_11710 [Candidatus Bathyarchaeia archaeon]|nr:hypothetical protein [Candidatus Bathyarchaeia archaeon]